MQWLHIVEVRCTSHWVDWASLNHWLKCYQTDMRVFRNILVRIGFKRERVTCVIPFCDSGDDSDNVVGVGRGVRLQGFFPHKPFQFRLAAATCWLWHWSHWFESADILWLHFAVLSTLFSILTHYWTPSPPKHITAFLICCLFLLVCLFFNLYLSISACLSHRYLSIFAFQVWRERAAKCIIRRIFFSTKMQADVIACSLLYI